MIDPNLPCGYCCGVHPCESDDPDHDDMDCAACDAVPLSDPHLECLEMVDEYIRLTRDELTIVDMSPTHE